MAEPDLREAVRLLATASTAMVLTARGAEQHAHGVDTTSAWINLALANGNDLLGTDDPAVFAIGECAQHRGEVYGLVAPAWEQAAVLADVLTGRPTRYLGSRLITRLKALGLEVAAMGDTGSSSCR